MEKIELVLTLEEEAEAVAEFNAPSNVYKSTFYFTKLRTHITSLTTAAFLRPAQLLPQSKSLPKFAIALILFDTILFLTLQFLGPNSILESYLHFAPCHRSQVWRFITYPYQYQPLLDILFQLIFKFYLTSTLEILNGTATIILVFYISTIFGSLLTSTLYSKMSLTSTISVLPGSLGLTIANCAMNPLIYRYAPVPVATLIYLCLLPLFALLNGIDVNFVVHVTSVGGGLLPGLYLLGTNEGSGRVKVLVGRLALGLLVVVLGWCFFMQRIDKKKFSCD